MYFHTSHSGKTDFHAEFFPQHTFDVVDIYWGHYGSHDAWTMALVLGERGFDINLGRDFDPLDLDFPVLTATSQQYLRVTKTEVCQVLESKIHWQRMTDRYRKSLKYFPDIDRGLKRGFTIDHHVLSAAVGLHEWGWSVLATEFCD